MSSLSYQQWIYTKYKITQLNGIQKTLHLLQLVIAFISWLLLCFSLAKIDSSEKSIIPPQLKHRPSYFRYEAHLAQGQTQEPQTVKAALSTPEKAKWLKAMGREMNSPEENMKKHVYSILAKI